MPTRPRSSIDVLVVSRGGDRPDGTLSKPTLDEAEFHEIVIKRQARWAETINKAVQESHRELIALLQPGWQWHPSFLRHALRAFANRPGLGAVSVVCQLENNGKYHLLGFDPLDTQTPIELQPNFLSGCVFRREAFLQAGGIERKESDFGCEEILARIREKWSVDLLPLALARGALPASDWKAWGAFWNDRLGVSNDEALFEKVFRRKFMGCWSLPLSKKLSFGRIWIRRAVAAMKRRLGEWSPLWAILTLIALLRSKLLPPPVNGGRHASSSDSPKRGCSSYAQEMVLGCYLTSSSCAQRNAQLPSESEPFMSWYKSILESNLSGVLFHDGLPPRITELFESERFRFIKVSGEPEGESPTDRRFRIYLDYLRNNPQVERAFLTDVTDVNVCQNPFEAGQFCDSKLFVGCEETRVGGCAYMWSRAGKACSRKQKRRFLGLLDRKLLNCGILGGEREVLLKALEQINLELDQTIPEENSDMVCLNLAIYGAFAEEQIFYGPPLHGRFKYYEARDDVWFRHK